MPREVDPALVPVEKAHGSVGTDSDVVGARVTVDDSGRHVVELIEHGEDLLDHRRRHGVEVGIDRATIRREVPHGDTARPLTMIEGRCVQSPELRGHLRPLDGRRRFGAVEPGLHDDPVHRSATVIGRHGHRNLETDGSEMVDEIQLPCERLRVIVGFDARPRLHHRTDRATPRFDSHRPTAQWPRGRSKGRGRATTMNQSAGSTQRVDGDR